jgi:hypothetical protein
MSLMAESGCLEQVDRGADNPTSYYKTIMKPVKGGQGPVWVVAPLIIIIIIRLVTNIGVQERVYSIFKNKVHIILMQRHA